MEQGSKAALGWAARDASGHLSPYSFSRFFLSLSLHVLFSFVLF
jgi:hypothetical protein